MKAILLLLSILTATAFTRGNRPGATECGPFAITVKFPKEYRTEVSDGQISFSHKSSTTSQIAEKLKDLRFLQVIPFTDSERTRIRSGRTLRSGKSRFNKGNFSGLLTVEGTSIMNREAVLTLADFLESLPGVEYCCVTSTSLDLPPSEIPDYTPFQNYLTGDGGGDTIGTYADFAWSLGITGQGVTIADVEYGWDFPHVEFDSERMVNATPGASMAYHSHGTAVAGIMFSKNDGLGTTGGAYGADSLLCFSETVEGGRVAAVALAIEALEPGDVLVYEMQTQKNPTGRYIPADYLQEIWDLTKAATDAGIIVVAAAGNGGANLDAYYFEEYKNRGDNGAIIVGGGTRVGRNKWTGSTYGERVNLQGYADKAFSTGNYSGSYNSSAPYYSSYTYFNGTSSATPVVASAVTLVQSYAKNRLGRVLTPKEMRDLLIETGTPQGSGPNVGPLPNVEAAIRKLDSDGLPELFTLTVNNGTGSGSYEMGTVIEISAEERQDYTFLQWSGNTDLLTDSTSAKTVLTMSSTNAEVTPIYEENRLELFSLTVTGGTGSGEFPTGSVVEISAEVPKNFSFVGWSGDTDLMADSTSETTTLIIGTTPVEVIALFEEDMATPSLSTPAFEQKQMSAGFISGKVQISIPLADEYVVKIFSLSGEQLFSSRNKFQSGSATVAIPALSKGMYLIQIQGDDVTKVFRAIYQ